MDTQMERTENTENTKDTKDTATTKRTAEWWEVREAMMPEINMRRLRGAMAEAQVGSSAVAQVAGLSSWHVRQLTREAVRAGHEARLRLAYAVKALNLDPEHVLLPPTIPTTPTAQAQSGEGAEGE